MKPSDILDQQEIELIGECLDAAVRGPFFVHEGADNPWWEFPILMRLEPGEMAQIADWWPNVEITHRDVQLAVNNSMNHLLSYPHKRWDVWPSYIPAPPEEVVRVLKKWRAGLGLIDGKSSNEHFNRYML